MPAKATSKGWPFSIQKILPMDFVVQLTQTIVKHKIGYFLSFINLGFFKILDIANEAQRLSLPHGWRALPIIIGVLTIIKLLYDIYKTHISIKKIKNEKKG